MRHSKARVVCPPLYTKGLTVGTSDMNRWLGFMSCAMKEQLLSRDRVSIDGAAETRLVGRNYVGMNRKMMVVGLCIHRRRISSERLYLLNILYYLHEFLTLIKIKDTISICLCEVTISLLRLIDHMSGLSPTRWMSPFTSRCLISAVFAADAMSSSALSVTLNAQRSSLSSLSVSISGSVKVTALCSSSTSTVLKNQ